MTSGNPQSVALSVSTPPAGVTATFDQTPVTAGAGAVLTLATAANTAPGSYTLVVTGTGNSASHTTSVTLTVNPVVVDDFSIDAAPSSVTVTAGQSGSSTISTAVTSGNAQSVALSASGMPSGVSISFSPATVTAGGSSSMTITTTPSAAAGTVTLVVTGTGASATRTVSVSLTVNAVVTDDFSIGATPGSVTVTAGQTATTTINTAVTSGNAQSISLSASGTPTGATVSFTPATLTAGQGSSLAVATTSGTPPGSYSLTVTGTGASATHTVTVSVTVTGGTTPPHQVQSAAATETSAATALTATLPVASTAGDLLVLSASVYTGATNHLTSITDSAGNVWRKVNAWSTASHNSDGELWYAANAAPTTMVTAHIATAATMTLQVQEFAGIAAVNPLDTSVGASNTGTSASSGPLTPAAAGELLVGFVAGHANAQAITVAPAGYTVLPQQASTGTITTVVVGYQVLSPASVSFTGSYSAAMYWAAGLVAFKPA
ncbi:MAG TPA: hypothetical protein VJ851_10610 [Jatrophihabitans sp.]|nr:hypothetical protein [Jatrophihabitans sp.]